MKKIYLFILFSIISVTTFAQVRIGGYVTTIGPNDIYPTHIDSLGKGGYRSVQTTAGLDSIPILRRRYGMKVRVNATNLEYLLGPDLLTWLVPKMTVDGVLSPTHSLTVAPGGNGIALYSVGGTNYKRGHIGMWNDTLSIMSQIGGAASPVNAIKIGASTSYGLNIPDKSARVLTIRNSMPNFLITSYTEQNGDIFAIRPQFNSNNGRQTALNVTANLKQTGTANAEVLRVGLVRDTSINRPTNLIYATSDGLERFSLNDVGGIKAPYLPSGSPIKYVGQTSDGTFVTANPTGDTAAVNAAIRGKADTTSNVSRRVGTVVNPTFTTNTVNQYTDVTPQAGVSWQNGYVQLSTGNNTPGNYIYNNNYVNNSLNWSTEIEFVPTAAGNGIGVGQFGANGTHMGRIVLTGTDNGKLIINTGTNIRATSDSSLVYALNDTLRLRFTENLNSYTVQAWKKNTPQDVVTLEWVNDKIFGTAFSNIRASSPAIFTYGGTQRVTKHLLTINDITLADIAFLGNSIEAGSFGGSTEGTWANRVKRSVAGNAVLIAASSNRTSDYLLLKPQIMSLKPKVLVTSLGINDIASGIPLATTKANITTIIKDCINNNIIPVFVTVLPVSSTYSNGSITNTMVRDTTAAFNTWLLGQKVKTINTFDALSVGGVLPSKYDSGDGLHPNAAGHAIVAAAISDGIKELVPMTRRSGYQNTIYANEDRNDFVGSGAGMSYRIGSGTAQASLNSYSDSYTAQPSRAGKSALFSTGAGNLVLGTTTAGTEMEFILGGANFSTNKIGGLSADSLYTSSKKISVINDQNGFTGMSVINPNTGTAASSQIRLNTNSAQTILSSYGSNVVNRSSFTGLFNNTGAGLMLGSVSGDILFGNNAADYSSPNMRLKNNATLLLNTQIDNGTDKLQLSGSAIFRGQVNPLKIDISAGNELGFVYQRAQLMRWRLYANATAETGSNAGSNYVIDAYNDAGTTASNVLSINRATQITTFRQGIAMTNTTVGVAGTDSLVVKDDASNTLRRIPANYYAVAGTGGSVTNFSFTNANGFTGVVTNPTTTPNLTLSADTAGTFVTKTYSNRYVRTNSSGQLNDLTLLTNNGIRFGRNNAFSYGRYGFAIFNKNGFMNAGSQIAIDSASQRTILKNVGLTTVTTGTAGTDSLVTIKADGALYKIAPNYYSTGTQIVEIAGTSQQASANTIYIPHNTSRTTITLPLEANAPVGTLVQVVGEGSGGWRIAQNASQFIVGVGSFQTTAGTTGYIESQEANCTVTLRKTLANKWTVTSSQGGLNQN